MQKNTIKDKLKVQQCVYGTSLEDCLDPEIAVVLAAAGLDFFFIDTEHCTASHSEIQGLCRAARAAGIIPMVRVTQNEPYLLSRAADVGAMGVIVPRVHSVGEARAAVKALKFPPLGKRGFGLRSIVTDLRSKSAAEEVASCNHELMIVLMIESREGLECVEEIAKVEGVDVLFIGPYDLTLSLEIIEQFDNPVFWRAVDRVIEACKQAGIAAGLQSRDMDMLIEVRRRGGRFLMYGSDTAVLFDAYKRAISQLKGSNSGSCVLY
ncbi:MAG TPA: aldolase/citrate lyase family protein [Candidatus Angelobacter sp.]|jgi:2-dehydro-3-deoxyglucarate aldolase/4-hydroxy-2-oxoheptanedioate aldolase|nr:aldolase/citrate lyase family protein [Candidatus Angelobacter sp.]